jgi:hypothetical protein
MTRLSRLWRVSFVAAAMLDALSAAPVLAQQARVATVCDCSDVYELINRLNMDQAAIEAIRDELMVMPDGLLDQTSPNGKTNQEQIRAVILAAMGSVQMRGASIAIGHTDGDCKPSIVDPPNRSTIRTACMEEVLLWHENEVHVPACGAAPKTVFGKRDAQTTKDYIKEEIRGYEAEMQRIRAILQSLPESCRPHGWLGIIYYYESRTLETRQSTQPRGNIVEKFTTTTNAFAREAKILYRENALSTIDADINETTTKFESEAGRFSCEAKGLSGYRPPDRTITHSASVETKIVASNLVDATVTFAYHPQSGDYALSFDFPESIGAGTSTVTNTAVNDCNDNGSKTTSGQFQQVVPSSPASLSGTGLPASAMLPDTNQGSDTNDLGPRLTSPDVSTAHTGKATWTLFRLP